MYDSVFVKGEFFSFVIIAFLLPVALYAFLMWKQAISRKTVLVLGLLLIAIAGTGVVLLQTLAGIARQSPSLLDDRFFVSELSLALYLIPALFAGLGINMISHLLTSHLTEAERRYDCEHGEDDEDGERQ